MSGDLLVIDGSHGEGGGQILRTSLALSMVTGRPVELERIRAGRPKPGLAAQHLTAVRAAAAISGARVEGAELGSQRLLFVPGPVRAGRYTFSVGAARPGGSAGAATLVLQTVLPPLALSGGSSEVIVEGGTHMEWSPLFDYLTTVWLPALEAMGASAALELVRWGFFPVGQGAIAARIEGGPGWFEPIRLTERGELSEVVGRSVGAGVPGHIAGRMALGAREVLANEGLAAEIEVLNVEAACPGAALFLAARYLGSAVGFTALGRRGKPAERVGAEAAEELLAFHRGAGVVDEHLADQILLPAALAAGESVVVTARRTGHLETDAWTVERFGVAEVRLEGTEPVRITVRPSAAEARTTSPARP